MTHNDSLPILLKKLKLSTMSSCWEEYLDKASINGWDAGQYLTALCEEELSQRESRKIERHQKESKLPIGKTLSSFDFSQIPNLDTQKIEALGVDPSWVRRADNLLFFGPSGTGKTHLAAAICNGLIQLGVRVRYYSATALVQELQRAREELQLEKAFVKLDRYAVLVLDDIGYVRKSEAETHVLFELIAHRYETKSIVVTANHPFSDWDHIFSDTMMTVAAIDRLVHHSMIIELQADSFRRKEAVEKTKINLQKQEDNNKQR